MFFVAIPLLSLVLVGASADEAEDIFAVLESGELSPDEVYQMLEGLTPDQIEALNQVN